MRPIPSLTMFPPQDLPCVFHLLSLEQSNFLAELTPFCIEARYGDFKESLSEILDKEKAEIIYQQTREFFKWLYQKIR